MSRSITDMAATIKRALADQEWTWFTGPPTQSSTERFLLDLLRPSSRKFQSVNSGGIMVQFYELDAGVKYAYDPPRVWVCVSGAEEDDATEDSA